MKKQYKGRKTNKAEKPTRPFEGMMKQLNKETLVLCNLNKFAEFTGALKAEGIEYELGDFYGDNIIIVKRP